MSSQIFLARNQKVFGPLSNDEIQALRQSGQLASYSWIWREGEPHWSPIDPPPALPALAKAPTTDRAPLHVVPEPPLYSEGAPAEAPALQATRPIARAHLVAQETFRVVLFDHKNAISGWLISAAEGGCEIRSEQNGSDPFFVQKESAALTLHDTRTGDTIKLRVQVSEIGRAGGGWTYRLRWNAAPALLNRSERSVAA